MKLLRVVMIGEEHPYYTITVAFQKKFDLVDTIWWNHYTPQNLDIVVRQHFENNKYDAVFMQLQTDIAILQETVDFMSQKSLVFNWTGDVTEHLNYFTKYAHSSVSLFSNETDVEKMRNLGFRADFLQTGYDHNIYYCTNAKYKYRQPAIVFCANNYKNYGYPLSEHRVEVAQALSSVFKENFVLCGKGWENVSGVSVSCYADNIHEARLYNYCSIAINLSNFNYKRYSSDRLFRELSCGSLVMSHDFQDYQKDFSDGEQLVVWSNIDDLINKCDNYLCDNKKARQIAERGISEAENKYRWTNTAERLIKLINKYK